MTNHPGITGCFIRDERQLDTESWDDPVRGRIDFRTFFGNGTSTSSLVTGVAEVPPAAAFALHQHDAVEAYYIVEGHGVVSLGGKEFVVGPGISAHVPSGVEHGIRNTADVPLKIFYVLAADSFAEIDYRFSAHPE
ncbi:cupin domain-containing protein [Arthrobacter sp. Sr33]